MNNIRNYTDNEILDRVRSLPSFHNIPEKYWLVGIRSDEDAFNRFDDKFYLFKGEQFIDVWPGTTNAGTDLLHPTNAKGEAVLKSDGIYYDSHERRKHRGKVMAYCQRIPLPLYRDADRDKKSEELGTARNEIVGINIHPSSYIVGNKAEREAIQGWSQGCQVFSTRSDFDKFMALTKGQSVLTYCLLKEFTPQKISAAAPAHTPAILPLQDGLDSEKQSATTAAVDNSVETPPSVANEPTSITESPYQGTGLINTLKLDFAKVGGGNLSFQALQGYATEASGWPPWVISIITKIATIAIILGAAWLIFRLAHYGIWKITEWKKQHLQATINTNKNLKDMKFVSATPVETAAAGK